MARIVQLAGARPVNEGERVVVARLAADLPDAFVLVPNVEIPDGSGHRLEYDLVVIAPHAVYAVETKAWTGDISGNDREWLVNGSTRAAPIRLTTHKARVFKSWLVDEAPVLRSAWVEPAVVLAIPPRSLALTVAGRERTFDIDQLVAFVRTPDGLPIRPRPVVDLVGRVSDLLTGRAAGRSAERAFREWRVTETLESDGEVTEYLAVHVDAPSATPVRLRVYSLSPYALSLEERNRRRKQLTREFAALALMGGHPNVVATREAFDDDHGNLVLVSDEIEGLSLSLALEEGLDLSDLEKARIVVDVCEALSHAHSHGVIHRRVCAENVLLIEGGAKLGGFGAARIPSEGTIYTTAMASSFDVRYMAPELMPLAGGDVTSACDVFGVGVLTWTLWAEDAPPSTGAAGLPAPAAMHAAIAEVVERSLSFDPSERCDSVDSFAAVVRSALGIGATVGTPAPAVSRDPQTAPLEYRAGDVIEDRYEVVARLGSGAFSIVYRARDAVADIDVALKLFSPMYGMDGAQRELRALRQIRHPNVVEVIDVGRTNTTPRQWYLKSECVSGQTIDRLLASSGPLAPKDAAKLLDQLLDAFIAFHPDTRRLNELRSKNELSDAEVEEQFELNARGLVHRDIKPQNLIQCDDGSLKVFDFNIAIRAGTPVQTVSGTPSYQPPDADLTQWDVSTDLFAAGVVFFELLTGEHPFVGRDPRQGRPRSPAEFIPSLNERLCSFTSKACAPEREERFATALEMRSALQNALSSLEDAVVVETVPEIAWWALVRAGVKDSFPETALPERPPVNEIAIAEPAPGVTVVLNVSETGATVALDAADDAEALARLREAHQSVIDDSQLALAADGFRLRTDIPIAGRAEVESSSEVVDAIGSLYLAALVNLNRPDRFEGETLEPGDLPDGHEQVGWIETSDVRLPLVVTKTAEGSVVLSAITSTGDVDMPPRGAHTCGCATVEHSHSSKRSRHGGACSPPQHAGAVGS